MIKVRLGDHVTFLSGFALKSKLFNEDRDGLPVVRIRDVVRGHSETFYSGEYDDRFLVSKGDYLIGMDGEFNVARWQSETALLNQRVCKIDAVSHDVDRGYLGRFLPVALKEIEDATPFVTVKHLSVKKLNEIQIPLPPLAEQKRIAAILDAADALRARRRESLAQLETLLQSTFLDMFGDPVANPMRWSTVPLETVCEGIVDCPHSTPVYSDAATGFFCIRSSDIQDGNVVLSEARHVSPEVYAERIKRHEPQASDVVYTREGGRLGLVGMIPRNKKVCLGQRMMLFRGAPEMALNPYLWGLLNCSAMYRKVVEMSGGGAAPRVNIKQLRQLEAIHPSLDLQHHFAAIVESVEQQKARMRSHLTELDALFASLQSRAFNGEL